MISEARRDAAPGARLSMESAGPVGLRNPTPLSASCTLPRALRFIPEPVVLPLPHGFGAGAWGNLSLRSAVECRWSFGERSGQPKDRRPPSAGRASVPYF